MFPKNRRWGRCALIVGLAFTLLAPMARAQGHDVDGSHDSPLITRYPGSYIYHYSHTEFDRFLLPLGKLIGDNKLTKSEKVKGKITRILYVAPAKVSALEVWQNYKTAVQKAGFTTLFRCRSAACSTDRWDVTLYRDQQDTWGDLGGGQYQLTAQRAGPNGTVYISLHVAGNPNFGGGYHTLTQLDIIEPHAMATGMIQVNAAAMASALAQSGHIALYGIYFDTAKAVLKPASDAALQQIVMLLRRQPTLKLYVVGNTDNVGAFASNVSLSDRRATAVVAALTGRYGIDSHRLKAVGIGPVDPMSTNQTPKGRSLNRRVELVEQ